MPEKIRLDIFIKDKFKLSRDNSKRAVENGFVKVNDNVVLKPSFLVNELDSIELSDSAYINYVGRGGLKLQKALDCFNLDLNSKICLDVGASTGGFTDCMLKSGAKLVYAVDVGTNQLSDTLKSDSRVVSIEKMDIRNFSESCPEIYFDFISIDVSFISVTKILPYVLNLLNSDSEIVVLIKPQFEAGKEYLNKKGVVKNKNIHVKVLKNIYSFCTENNIQIGGIDFSPITGGSGNIEYLIYLRNFGKGLDIVNFGNEVNFAVSTAYKSLLG